jgi:hypothetical protein
VRREITLLQRFANRRDDSHRIAVALHGGDLQSVSQFQIGIVNQGQRALQGTTQTAQIVSNTPPVI